MNLPSARELGTTVQRISIVDIVARGFQFLVSERPAGFLITWFWGWTLRIFTSSSSWFIRCCKRLLFEIFEVFLVIFFLVIHLKKKYSRINQKNEKNTLWTILYRDASYIFLFNKFSIISRSSKGCKGRIIRKTKTVQDKPYLWLHCQTFCTRSCFQHLKKSKIESNNIKMSFTEQYASNKFKGRRAESSTSLKAQFKLSWTVKSILSNTTGRDVLKFAIMI